MADRVRHFIRLISENQFALDDEDDEVGQPVRMEPFDARHSGSRMISRISLPSITHESHYFVSPRWDESKNEFLISGKIRASFGPAVIVQAVLVLLSLPIWNEDKRTVSFQDSNHRE